MVSDMYLGRDAGWIMIDAFNAQEAYDLMLMGFKIAEDLNVRLPVMVNQDGFITSHTAQNVKPLQDEVAYNFIGEYKEVNPMLDFCKPVTYGAQTEEDWHFEFKARQHKALMDSKDIIENVFEEFESLTQRKYNLVESYLMEDAQVAIVALGSTVESAVQAAKDLRENEGIKAGVVATRAIRPFPLKEVIEALKGVKAIATLDRSAPGGTLGMLYNEISGAMYQSDKRPIISNYIYGLGGRDMTQKDIKDIFADAKRNADAGKLVTPLQQFSGLRGPKLSFFN